ncbi:MAG: LysM peptidoglycan-binding domain-containing protein [Kiritimatiellales bacterium]
MSKLLEKEFLMKAKVIGVLVLVLHIVVLAGFSLMQGCTTGTSPIPWLNIPQKQETLPSYVSEDLTPLPPPVDTAYAPPPVTSSAYVPPAAAAMPSADDQTYSVQKGDTLSVIAAKYGTTWKKLADYNGLTNPNQLRVGQKLNIPGALSAKSTTAAAPSSAPKALISQGGTYVIQRGDTLGGIAKRSGVTIAELKAANHMTSDRIIAGKSITIPKHGTVPSSAAVAETIPATTTAAAPAVETAPAAVPADVAPVAVSSAAPVYDHILYPGETLNDVARQFGVSKDSIMKLNNITDESTLKPGTKLLVPLP